MGVQSSKFKFEFGGTCATSCKFLGAQLIMLGAPISKEKVKFICHLQFVTFTSVLRLIKTQPICYAVIPL